MKQRTEAQRKAYLRRVLQMNPIEQGRQIFALRDRFRGIQAEHAAAGKDPNEIRELRQQTAGQIEQLRSEFWSLDLRTLNHRIQQLPINQFPDLKNAAYRLLTVARHRQLLPRLTQSKRFSPDFFSSLKEILVLSPREAAQVKERAIQSLKGRKKLQNVKAMLRQINKDLPEIYALEEDWFEVVMSIKPRPKKVQQHAAVESEEGCGADLGWGGVVLIYFLIKALILAARYGGNN